MLDGGRGKSTVYPRGIYLQLNRQFEEKVSCTVNRGAWYIEGLLKYNYIYSSHNFIEFLLPDNHLIFADGTPDVKQEQEYKVRGAPVPSSAYKTPQVFVVTLIYPVGA